MATSLLDADLLLAALAGTPWREVDVHDSVDSTNLDALRRPVPWRVVAAGHQSAGRGRMTRPWQSPQGTSVAVSAVVPLPARPRDWAWLPLLTGLAARAAVLAACGDAVEVGLKWPNDVMMRAAGSADDRDDAGWGKVAGILCETAPAGDDPAAVVGSGFNIAQRADELPVPSATSLAACGVDVGAREEDRVMFATGLVAAYLTGLARQATVLADGGRAFQGERSAYRSACASVGRRVAVHRAAGGRVTGVATGVDEQGRLVVRDGGGGESAYAAGDVEHLR